MGIKSILRILLALAIIAGYFLPWLQFVGSASAFDIVRTAGEGAGGTSGQVVWYASVLIPLFALICLIQSISNKTPSGFARTIPFIVTVIIVGLLFLGSTADESSIDTDSLFSMLGLGVYITLAASFLLIFMGRDRVHANVNTSATY